MRRASSQIDFAALGRAMARPGMDPRAWCSLAIVQSVVVDEAEGVFCDVLLMPSKRRETARLGAAYAGSGWGLYAPPMVDDEVLVSAPSGDPAQGLVITSRLWSPADVPPADAATHPEDVLLTVRPDKSLRIKVQGGGNVILAVDTGKVFLGSETGTEAVAKGESLKSYLDGIVDQLNGHTHTSAAAGVVTSTMQLSVDPTVLVGPTSAILSTTSEVK
jgi:phage baseplate assembly protein gpV